MSSSNPTKTFPPTPAPTSPYPKTANGISLEIDKDLIIADLRRQLEESQSDMSSNAGSNSSSGRRRRRNKNKNKGGGQKAGNGSMLELVTQKKDGNGPVKLQLGLNLDVELELKAKIRGDITIALVVEKKRQIPPENEKKFKGPGTIEVFEMCYVRLGTLDFTRKWLDKDVSESLTVAAVLGILALGMLIGYLGRAFVGGRGECYMEALRSYRLEKIMFDMGL